MMLYSNDFPIKAKDAPLYLKYRYVDNGCYIVTSNDHDNRDTFITPGQSQARGMGSPHLKVQRNDLIE